MGKNLFSVICLCIALVCNVLKLLRGFDGFTLVTFCVTVLAVILLLLEDKRRES